MYNSYRQPALAQHQPAAGNVGPSYNFSVHPVAQSVPSDYYSQFAHQNQAMMFQRPQQHHVSAYSVPIRPEVHTSYPSAEASLAHAGQHQYRAISSAGPQAGHGQHQVHAYIQGGDNPSLLRVVGVPAPRGGPPGAAAALSGSGPPAPGSPGVRPQPLQYAKPDPAEWHLPTGSSSTAPPLLRLDARQHMRYQGPLRVQVHLQHAPCMSPHCCAYCSQGRPRNRPMIRCTSCSRLHHVGTFVIRFAVSLQCLHVPLFPAECCVSVEHEPLWGDSYYDFFCGYCGQGVESYARVVQPSWQEVTQLALLQLITSFSLAHEAQLLAELKRLGAVGSNSTVGDIPVQATLDSILTKKDLPPRRHLAIAVFHPASAIANMVELMAPVLLHNQGGVSAIPATYRPSLEVMISNVPSAFASGQGTVFAHSGYWTLTAAGVLTGHDDFLPPAVGMIAVLQQALLGQTFARGGLVDARLPPAAMEVTMESATPPVDPLMQQALNPNLGQSFHHSNVNDNSAALPLTVISASAASTRPSQAAEIDAPRPSYEAPPLNKFYLGEGQQEHREVLRALNGEEPQLSLQALMKAQAEALFLNVSTASGTWRQAFAAATDSGKMHRDTARLVASGDKRSFVYSGATVWGRVPLSWILLRLHSSVADTVLASLQVTEADSTKSSTQSSPQSRSESAQSATDIDDVSEDSAKPAEQISARAKIVKLLSEKRQHNVWWPMQVAMPPATSGSLTSVVPFLGDEHLWIESHDLLPLSKTPTRGIRAQLSIDATERAAAEAGKSSAAAASPNSPALPPTSTPERRLNPARDGRNAKRRERSSQALGQLPLAVRPVFFDAVSTALVTCLLHCIPGAVGAVLGAAVQAARDAPGDDSVSPGGSIESLAAVATMFGASYSALGSSDSELLGEESTLDAPTEALLKQLGVLKTAITHAVKTTSVTEEQSPVVRQALLQAAGTALRLSFQGGLASCAGSVTARGAAVHGNILSSVSDAEAEQTSDAEAEATKTARSLRVRCVYEAPDKTHGAFSPAFAPVRTKDLPPFRVRMPAAVADLPQQDARWSFDDQNTPSIASEETNAQNGLSASGTNPAASAVEFVPRAGRNATAAAQLLRAAGVPPSGTNTGCIGLVASNSPPADAANSHRERAFKRSLCGLFLGADCEVDGAPVLGTKRPRDADLSPSHALVCHTVDIAPASSLQVSTLEDEAAAPGATAPGRVLGDLLPSARQEVLDGLEFDANKRRRLQRMWRTPLVQFGCSHVLHDDWLQDELVTGSVAPTDVAGVSAAPQDSDEESDCASVSSETSRTWALSGLDAAVSFMPGMRKQDRLSSLLGTNTQLSERQREASAAFLLASESTLVEGNASASTSAAFATEASLDAAQTAHMAAFFAAAARPSRRERNKASDAATADSNDDAGSVLSTDSLAHAWQAQAAAHSSAGRRSRRYAEGTAETAAVEAAHSSAEGGNTSSSVSVTSSDLGSDGDVQLLRDAGQQRDGPLDVPLHVAQADVLRRHIEAGGETASGPQVRKLFLAGIMEAFRPSALQSASRLAGHSGGSPGPLTQHATAVQAGGAYTDASQPSDSPASQSAPGGSAGPPPLSDGMPQQTHAHKPLATEASLTSSSSGAASSLQSAGPTGSLKSTRSAASSVHSKPRAGSTDMGAGSVMSGATGDSDDESDDEEDEDDSEASWDDSAGGISGPRSLRKLEERGIFVIERIIRHKTVKRKRRFYVKWRGYGPENNSWVWGEDILDKNAIQEYDVQRKQRKAARIQRMRRGSASTNPSIVATKEGSKQ